MAKLIFSREKILNTAIDMARKVGFKKLSMRGLAKKLGCSVIPIYENFLNKEHLLEQIFYEVTNELREMCPDSYLKRNEQLLLFGLKYPILYFDVRKYSLKSDYTEDLLNDVFNLMYKDSILKRLPQKDLKEINRRLVIFIGGIVERACMESNIKYVPHSEYVEMLNSVSMAIINNCIKRGNY